MISWTKLLTGETQDHDNLRYSDCNNGVPKIVVWNTTARCNLQCQHCYFGATRDGDDHGFTRREAEDFIEDLARMGVPVLLFSGGEPLLKRDIFELGKFTAEKGIKAVLSTNGTLITEEVADKIKAARFSYVGISLDGTEKTNDTFRQKEGAFNASVAGIKNCQKAGLKVGLRFTIARHTINDLPAIFDLVEQESIPRLCIYHLVYSGRGKEMKLHDISHEERRQALELIWERTLRLSSGSRGIEVLTVDNHTDGVWMYLKLKKLKSSRAQEVLKLLKVQGGNSTGIRIGAVDNRADVYPDQFWRTHCLGNIRVKRFSDIWQDTENKFLNVLRNRKSILNNRCKKCGFLELCNGNFRARAEAVSGDPWAEDPSCYLTDEEISGQ